MKKDDSIDSHKSTFVAGGLFHKISTFFHKKNVSVIGSPRVAIGLVLITWVPLFLMSIFSGTNEPSVESISFFEDFFLQVRLLLVLPFLILVEKPFDKTFVKYIQNTYKLVNEDDKEKFMTLVDRIRRLVKSFLPEILFLLLVYVLTIQNWNELWVFDSDRNYLTNSENSLNAAGWYYILVCSPLLQLLIFRWFWRWIIWAYSIFSISGLNLKVDFLHADTMAGLQYLNYTPLTLSIAMIGPSAILSSYIGVEIIQYGSALSDYAIEIVAYVIVFPILLYLPLLFFQPALAKAKRYGIQYFGDLVRMHNLEYDQKWIKGDLPKDEPLVGSPDHSSLADINGSYGPIQSMKPFPIDFKMIILSMILSILPYLPLVFTYYSATELFKMLISNVLGH
jgi:hypothetical protein